MVLLSGLNRTITESAISPWNGCGKLVYSERTARFIYSVGRHIESTNAYFCQEFVLPCTTLEEVASWVLQSLPLQAWRYLEVLHGNNKDVCSLESKRFFESAWRSALFHFYATHALLYQITRRRVRSQDANPSQAPPVVSDLSCRSSESLEIYYSKSRMTATMRVQDE